MARPTPAQRQQARRDAAWHVASWARGTLAADPELRSEGEPLDPESAKYTLLMREIRRIVDALERRS